MSGIYIAHLKQSSIDLAEGLLKRRLTWEEKNGMYDHVIVHSQAAADRLIEHFRLTGQIAFIEEEDAK